MASALCGHRQAMSQCSSTGHPARLRRGESVLDIALEEQAELARRDTLLVAGHPIAEFPQDRPCPGHAFPWHQDVEVSGDAEGRVAVQRLRQRHPLQRDNRHAHPAQPFEHPTEGASDKRVPRSVDPTPGLEGRSHRRWDIGPTQRREASGGEGHDTMCLSSIHEARPGNAAHEAARAPLEISGEVAPGEDSQ